MFLIPSDAPADIGNTWLVMGSPLPAFTAMMTKDFMGKSKKNQRTSFGMLNDYTVAPHYHNMLHLLSSVNKAELLRDCLQDKIHSNKAISMTRSPLFYAGPAVTNILLGWLTRQA
jgi:hypothetical protein